MYSQDLKGLCGHYDSKIGPVIPNVKTVGQKYVIKVLNENDFRQLNSSICKAIESGETNIVVCLKKSVYYFNQNHIDLRGFNSPMVSISIEGNGSIIRPVCQAYSSLTKTEGISSCDFSGDFSRESIFLTDNDEILDVWTTMKQALGAVKVNNKNSASIPTIFQGPISQDSWIRIPHWYYSTQYPISQVTKDGNVTFTAQTSKGFDVDYDGKYVLGYDTRVSSELVRYQCFNVPNMEVPYCRDKTMYFPSKYKTIYDCKAGNFILIASTILKQLNVTGLECVGARGGGHYINLSGVKAEKISFSNCSFRGLKNTLLMINKTDNVSFCDNTVTCCYGQGIYSTNGSKNTIVANCLFSNNGLSMIQHSCIYCVGENYHIYKNEIRDFTYAAIFVGLHSTAEKNSVCSGIIEENEIYYSKEYYENYWKYTLADGGAIYISSQNDEVIIRYNYIHDYRGINGNRAIFGDTGAKNVVIYGNVILRVPNYYAIDLYRVKSADKNMPDANSGNLVFANYIDGAYKLGGREGGACKDGGNILISNTYNRFNEPQVTNSKAIDKNIEGNSKMGRVERQQAKRKIPIYSRLKRLL